MRFRFKINYLSSSVLNLYRNRKRRSLEESENGATEEPARDSMETADVSVALLKWYHIHILVIFKCN